MTQQQLAPMVGMAWQTLGKLERGASQLKVHQARRISQALGCDPDDLEEGAPSRNVPVMGYVGAGAEIFPFGDIPEREGMRQVQCPVGLDPAKTIAAEVRGDSMFPIGDGWLIFFGRGNGVPYEAVGQMCVVKLAHDGPTLVKHLRPGYRRGRFNLISTNAAPREDVELDWAALVRAVLPPDLVERPPIAPHRSASAAASSPSSGARFNAATKPKKLEPAEPL